MDALTTPSGLLAVVAVVLLLLALAGWIVARRRRTFTPPLQFGGTQVDAHPRATERPAGPLTLMPISAAEAARFGAAWGVLQARFRDSPKGVVTQADQLLRDVMLARGYPVGDFDRRAAEVAVEHPDLVGHYRAVQSIALRDQRGEADRDEQGQALVHYRALFDELLAVAPAAAPVSMNDRRPRVGV